MSEEGRREAERQSGECPDGSGKKEERNDPRQPGLSRRAFVQFAGGLGAAVALSACTPKGVAEEGVKTTAVDGDAIMAKIYNMPQYGHAPMLAPYTFQNHLAEPAIPDKRSLADLGIKSEYNVDVLVVGGGFAGIYAADRAHELGKKVLLVDKGTVGKSGLTPWAHTFAFFDESLGDDRNAMVKQAMQDHQYSGNLDYFNLFLDRSKEIYEQALDWGWLHPHDWNTSDEIPKTPAKMLQEHAKIDRHLILRQRLVDQKIELIERVMLTDLIKENGRVMGAMGFHMESDEVITIKAKSVILCTGPGAVRPTGFPTGSSTWDGDGMAYRAGASISGKEYTDFHWTLADMPGDVYSMWWRSFLEGQLLFTAHYPTQIMMMADVLQVDQDGGFITPDRSEVDEVLQGDKAAVEEDADASHDPRKGLGNTITPDYLWINRELKECAIGMGLPKEEGVWPVDDKCFSGIPGLWVAGDALASCMAGAIYVCMGSSCVSSAIQGKVCAEQAAAYVDTVEAPNPSAGTLSAVKERVLAPLKREKGFSPAWLEEMLCNIMAPYWVAYMKTPETLNAALSQLVTTRDKTLGNLRARTTHELRYCHEMQNKFLSCEMKLRASLFRTESRGMHYRYDYPYRDDKNWMAWILIKQGENGEMELRKEPMPKEMQGDLNEPYTQRYPLRFPGELEALGISA
ncbi:MAG: FAD-binding protein [Coriobacteriia bacterium]